MLTDRQKDILKAIIEIYTESDNVEPVGSHTLMKLNSFSKYSSATLRNEMAELENQGYLDKTHTSSGRVPTELGYRLYVDELMNLDEIEEIVDQVDQLLEANHGSKKEVIRGFVKSIVDNPEFNYGAIVLEKTAFNSRIKRISFTPTRNHKGVFVLITDQGQVLYKEVLIPEGLGMGNIEKTVNYLNDHLKDYLLNDLKTANQIKFPNDGFFDYMSNAESTLELVLRNIFQLVEDKKEIIGQFNILNHRDFSSIELAQAYLDSLKDESIYQIVEFDNGPLPVIASNDKINLTIKIGKENTGEVFKNCSCITAYYQSKNGTGAITVYGPIRMKYKYVVAALSALVKSIN